MGPSVPVMATASVRSPVGVKEGSRAAVASMSATLGRVYLPVNSNELCLISFCTTLGETSAASSIVAISHLKLWKSKTNPAWSR
jgi:hypothetical protein